MFYLSSWTGKENKIKRTVKHMDKEVDNPAVNQT